MVYQEGCRIDYQDDCAVVTVTLFLKYDQGPAIPSRSRGFEHLRAEVGRYLCGSPQKLRKPDRHVVKEIAPPSGRG